MGGFARKDNEGYMRHRYIRFMLVFVLLNTLFLMSGCGLSSTQIGSYYIAESNHYEIEEPSSMHEIRTHREKAILTCDTTIMLDGSQYGIGAAWFNGVSLEEAKRYFDEHGLNKESLLDNRFNAQMQEPKSINTCNIVSQCGISGFRIEEKSIVDLGEPYSYHLEAFIFSASEDSIGVLTSVAHSNEQKKMQKGLLDEVICNLKTD